MEDNNTLLAAGILIFAMLIIIVFASFGKKKDPNSFYRAGLKAYDEGEFLTAYKIFKSLAEQGYIEAQCKLG